MSMSRGVAAVVIALTLVLLIVDLVLFEFFGQFIVIPFALSLLAFVGALLVARIPRNPVGWLLCASGMCLELTLAGGAYAWAALIRDPGALPGAHIAAALGNALFAPGLGMAVLMLLFFPSGRGLGGRWTWLERVLIAFVVLLGGLSFLKDTPISVAVPLNSDSGQPVFVTNPFALHGAPGALVAALAALTDSSTLPLVLVGPLSLFIRYRRSSHIEREQIKWLAYSGTLALTLLVASNFSSGDLSNWLWAAGAVVLGTLPIAIAIAIFRYRLYDIDVLIRRTLIYAALSAVLIGAYVGAVALTETLLASFTGGSGVAVAVSTLAVVALFQPVRKRVQGAVDRRFYRAKYDAERTLDVFAARLRDQIDLASLQRELLGAVSETVQPAQAGVWLRR